MVLGDANIASASSAGVSTLLRWVQGGGRLVVPGGQTGAALAASPLAPLLPLQVSGTRVVEGGLAPLGPWLGSPAPRDPALLLAAAPVAAAVLRTPPGTGLIYERPAGAGTVTMTAFDTTTEPLKYWSGQTALWRALLAEADRRVPPDRGVYQQLAQTFAEQRLPSPWFALSFLSLYLLALVPGQYLVLRRLDRRELAWVVTPLLIGAFTLGGVVIGLGPQRRLPVLQRVGVISTSSGAGAGRGEVAVALYSPRTRTHAVKCSADVGALIFPQEDARGGLEGAPRREVRYGPGLTLSNLRLKTGGTTSFVARALVPLGAGLTVHWARLYSNGTVKARVTNGTPFTIKDFYLKAPRLLRAPGLRPGQTAELAFEAAGQSGPGARGTPHGPPSPEPPTDLPLGERGPLLAERLMVAKELLAVTDQPLTELTLQARAVTHDLGGLLLPVDLTLETGGQAYTIPEWMVGYRPAGTPGKAGGWYQTDLLLPTRGLPVRARHIRLAFRSPGRGFRLGSGIQFFNFASGRWVAATVFAGSARPEPAADYLSPAGVISLRTSFEAQLTHSTPALALYGGVWSGGTPMGSPPPALPPPPPPAAPQVSYSVDVTVEPTGGTTP